MDKLRTYLLAFARKALGAGRSRRRAAAVLVVTPAAAATLVVLGLLVPASAAAAEASCPTPPPDHLYFDGTLTEGTLKLGSKASASGMSATISCGLESLLNDSISIPASGVVYQPFQLKLVGVLPLEATITLDGPAEGSMTSAFRTNELGEAEFAGYNSSLTSPVTSTVTVAVAGVGLQECSDGPIVPTLTTGKSGSLEGHILEGLITTGLEGELVANEFAVPKIQPSPTCSIVAAELSNTLLGLPLAPGESSITTKTSIKAQ
jgi:hypothetical protein